MMRQPEATDETWKRMLATVIDYIVIVAFSYWLVRTYGTETEPGRYELNGLPAIIPVIFWFLWIVVTEGVVGQTLGHKLAGLKVLDQYGEKVGFGQALVRRLFDLIEISCSLGLIALIIVKTSRSRQRIGDLVAKTFVVDKDYIHSQEFDFEGTGTNT